ncbi:MAG TPA: pyridoxamine 5'-phosphate oxidase family protein [Solirubrobacteraceae bacterium]|nr:pyridoxamine 5'-phosphate oxidase family protein [Solirubrobacteraceae bacterium]
MTDLPASPRVKLRREPSRGRHDRATIEAILDRALVAHIAFVDDGQPYCIPTLCARIDDRVLIHGSAASRMLRTLTTGAPACLTATCTDGIVLARSVFNHSINYASAIVLGELEAVTDPGEKLAALEAFTEKLVPGRWAEVRPPSPKELKATAILQMRIEEASAKLRTGPPSAEDPEVEAWAGVVPIVTAYGEPIPSPEQAPDLELAPSVARLLAG